MDKNVNTELEQFGVSVSDGVIHLFSRAFWVETKDPTFQTMYIICY